MILVIYDEDGRISRTVGGDLNMSGGIYDLERNLLAEYVDLNTDYVDVSTTPPSLARRPYFPPFDKLEITADDTDEATVMGLPDPCTVTVDEVPYTITGGTFSVTAAIPATYTVRMEQWPYLPKEVSVEALPV